MKDIEIKVSFESPWYIAEVVGKESDYYAQGSTYEESLSNLFSVIKAMKELDRPKVSQSFGDVITFSVPCTA